MTQANYDLAFSLPVRRVLYSGSEGDEIRAGMAVCYDYDNATTRHQEGVVETPSLGNKDRFAGVITDSNIGTVDSTGEMWVEIVDVSAAVKIPGVEVYTDQNVSSGDIMGLMPGTREFKKYVGFGKPIFRSSQTVDRSSTAGTARGDLGLLFLDAADVADKVTIYDNDFVESINWSETADVAGWNATFVDGGTGNAEVITIADAAQGGYLSSKTNTADNDVNNLQLNGEAFKLDKSCMLLAKGINIDDVSTADWFVGLSVTDATIMGGATDRIGFEVPAASSPADVEFVAEKNSTPTNVDTGLDATDATDLADLIFWYDADQDEIHVFASGSEVLNSGSAISAANVPDDVAMTLSIEIRNASAAASTLKIDRLYCANYRG